MLRAADAPSSTEKFDEMDQTIALKSDRRDDEALALIRTNRGKALMDEANVFFSGIIRAADERLTTGVGEQQGERHHAALGLDHRRHPDRAGGRGALSSRCVRYTARDRAGARRGRASSTRASNSACKERTADLARANDEIQRFAYIVTHDLRAPLVNIMGFTSELEGGVNSLQALIEKSQGRRPTHGSGGAAGARRGDGGSARGDRLHPLLDQEDGRVSSSAILKLSREGRRQLRPERDRSRRSRSQASAAAIQHQLSEAGGEISRCELEVPTIVTDRLSLEQILGNLLDNAVKYRSNGRPLRIGVRTERGLPATTSRSRSPTMGAALPIRIASACSSCSGVPAPQDQPGEGIGLAHVRTLVRNLGGDITVTSALDKGTTFRVVLPHRLQAPGKPDRMSRETTSPSPSSWSRTTRATRASSRRTSAGPA